MNGRDPAVAQTFLLWETRKRKPRCIEKSDCSARIRLPDNNGGLIGEDAKSLLALLQLFCSFLTLNHLHLQCKLCIHKACQFLYNRFLTLKCLNPQYKLYIHKIC